MSRRFSFQNKNIHLKKFKYNVSNRLARHSLFSNLKSKLICILKVCKLLTKIKKNLKCNYFVV